QLDGVRLVEDAGLEIEPGGQVEVTVTRAGIAVDAAVLAALVGIDGAVEGDVGGVVATQDAARGERPELGRGIGRRLVVGRRRLRLDVPDGEAPGRLRDGAAALPGRVRRHDRGSSLAGYRYSRPAARGRQPALSARAQAARTSPSAAAPQAACSLRRMTPRIANVRPMPAASPARKPARCAPTSVCSSPVPV